MTLFSRYETPSDFGRPAAPRGRQILRRDRVQALAGFMEDLGILVRYATGRDYYDRRMTIPKD